ncbi:putative transposase [Bathymodiolus platifrons methanotrophic gill symbiont]|uniref:putative transposase n=1 Tax=Bathymodiolus platifrons methanotrophic gill symbiont TaxID=113268 RepID=UPI003B84AF46
MKQLTQDEGPQQWSEALCKEWMQSAPEQASILYIDGHVRVYNGQQTKTSASPRCPTKTLFAGNHGLLGQCDGWTALHGH